MIGVLVAFDPRQTIGRKHLVGLLFFELGNHGRLGDAAFNADLDLGLDPSGLVQAADRHIEVI